MSGTKPSIIVRSFRGQQLFLVGVHSGRGYHWSADRSEALVMDYYDALDIARRATREYGAECAVLDKDGVLTQPAKMVPQKSQLQQAQDLRAPEPTHPLNPNRTGEDEPVPEPFAHPSRAPWSTVEGAPTCVWDADHQYVATVAREPDARLIAAAPQLLAALKAFANVGLIETAGHTTDDKPSNCTCAVHGELLAALQSAGVAVDKAEGRS